MLRSLDHFCSHRHSEGLVAQALPISLGADVELEVAVDLTLGLRLRSAIGIEACLDILGLDIGAGAEVAVWISLFDYTTTLVAVDDDEKCPVSAKEAFALVAGVAVELDVEVGDLLDFHIAPSVLVTLATGASLDVCLPAPGSSASHGGHNIATSATAGIAASSTSDVLGAGETGSQVAPGAGIGYTTNSAGSLVPTGTGLPVGTGASSGSAATSTALPYGNATITSAGGSDLVTSTITTTAVYTVTSCAITVPNCPASMTQKIVTSTVDVYTTICPATMTSAASSSSIYSSASIPAPTGTPVIITPCPTPTTSTYTAPSDVPTPAPTVTIVENTTVCPETQTGGAATKPTSGAAQPTGIYVGKPTGPAVGSYTQVGPLSTGTGAPAPVGTGSYTYVPPKPTSTPVTAGAGKVAGGAAALVLPIVAALML